MAWQAHPGPPQPYGQPPSQRPPFGLQPPNAPPYGTIPPSLPPQQIPWLPAPGPGIPPHASSVPRPPMPPPGPVWREATTPEGRKYYFNAVTQQTTWEKPDELLTFEERALKASPWKEFTSPEGKKYYHNSATNQTVWDIPDEYRELLENVKNQRPPDLSGSGNPLSASGSSILPSQLPSGPFTGQIPPVGGIPGFSGPSPSSTGRPALHTPMYQQQQQQTQQQQPQQQQQQQLAKQQQQAQPVSEFASREEAEEAFSNLLRETGVRPDWTWEETMRKIITHPMYKALKTLKERKDAFNRFVEETLRREREERDERSRAIKEAFFEMLERRKEELREGNLKYRRAAELFGDEEAWKNVLDERTRERMYEDFVDNMRRELKGALRERRKRNMENFAKLLRSLPSITHSTRWRDAQLIYTTAPEFEDLDTMGMDALDFLAVFEDYIKSLEHEYNTAMQKKIDDRRKQERKNRDGFKTLLGELRLDGKIHERARWMDVYLLFKEDPRYTDMLGQPGSTPLELFWDVVEDCAEKLDKERWLVVEFLRSVGFEVTTRTAFEEFAAIVKSEKSLIIGEPNLKLIFENLQKKAEQNEREERKRAERRLRRKMDAFKSVLKRLDGLTVATTWEEARSKLESRSEFEDLDEASRIEVFDRFIRRLREKEAVAEESEEGAIREEDDEEYRRDKDKKRERRHRHRRSRERSKSRDRSRRRGSASDSDEGERSRRRKKQRTHHHRDRSPTPDSDASSASSSSHHHSSRRRNGGHHDSRMPPPRPRRESRPYRDLDDVGRE